MSEDIPFNRILDLAPGVVEEVVPGVRRILVDNPSPFTFKGTLSYIVGHGKVAIIDPGPVDAQHTAALLDAATEVRDHGTFGYLDGTLPTPDWNRFMTTKGS